MLAKKFTPTLTILSRTSSLSEAKFDLFEQYKKVIMRSTAGSARVARGPDPDRHIL